jgi:hypothetical protein
MQIRVSLTFDSSTCRLTLLSRLMLSLTALVSLSVSSPAATFYVATTGSDSNAGTQGAPFATVAKGYASAAAGDIVMIEDGTYGNNGNVGTLGTCCTPAVDMRHGGTSSAAITIRAQNQGKAILDCGTLSSSQLGCDEYFFLHNGANYIVFQGLTIQGATWYGIGTEGGVSVDNIEILNCTIQNIGNIVDPTALGKAGIFVSNGGSGWTIDSNIFTNIGRTSSNGQLSLDHDHAIYSYASNVSVTNNVFYNLTRGWAYQVSPGSSNILIANNTFSDIYPACTATPGPGCGDAGQIQLWADPPGLSNVTIENNIFNQPTTSAVGACCPGSFSGSSFDYNLVYGVAASGVGGVSGWTVGSHNNIGATPASNPNFLSLSTPNFRVQAGSPAIGTGVTLSAITHDIAGTARSAPYTLGAYQYTSGTGNACDLNGDGILNAQDYSLIVDMAVGLVPCTANIVAADVCSAVTVQRVVNAVLGGACVTGP